MEYIKNIIDETISNLSPSDEKKNVLEGYRKRKGNKNKSRSSMTKNSSKGNLGILWFFLIVVISCISG